MSDKRVPDPPRDPEAPSDERLEWRHATHGQSGEGAIQPYASRSDTVTTTQPFVMPEVVDRVVLSMSSWGLLDWWEYDFTGHAHKEERWALNARAGLSPRPSRVGPEVLKGEAEFDPDEFTILVRKLRKLPLAAPMQGENDVFATDLPDWALEVEGSGSQAGVSGYGVTERGMGDKGPGGLALKQAIGLIHSLGRRLIWEQRIVPDDGSPEAGG
jgi:hypothetical protein